MDQRRLVKLSKSLSRTLRHQPERLGLRLDAAGWVAVDDLLRATGISREELEEVVERNDKRRYSFDETGTRIRANQGHSVAVDLGLPAVAPPAVLFHGTGRARVDAILREGLHRGGRHHVHLSPDVETARTVGRRHGPPVVLEVDAAAMAADGHTFHVTANDVWLTEAVPPAYLRSLGSGSARE